MQIKDRWSGAVLWEGECDNIREELQAAAKSGADLSGADLSGADLSGADLSGADLSGANLSGVDLSGVDLSGANLSGVDLSGVDLSGVDLSGANLSGVDLSGANLSGADLSGANLSGADLSGAYLSRAVGINPLRFTPLLMLLDQPGPIRAYKLTDAGGVGPYNGGITYEVGGTYEVVYANTDPNEQCAAGINVATLDWCLREYQPGYRVFVVEFEAGDIAAIPTGTDGKFRLHRCRVVGEKTKVELGIDPDNEEEGS